jgi:adenylate cyclase
MDTTREPGRMTPSSRLRHKRGLLEQPRKRAGEARWVMEEREGSAMNCAPSPILAILFADICGSVRLYELKGDAEAQRMTAWSIRIMAETTRLSGGRLVGTRGDGVMSTFATANAAYEAALEMQRAHRSTPISIRVGVGIGPVIEEDGEIFGDAANTAARITALARSGEILMTEETVSLLDTDHLASTHLFDTTTVRGKSRPIRIYRAIVEEATQATLSAPPRALDLAHARSHALLLSCATGKQIRVDREGQAVVMGRDEQCDLVVDGPYASRRHAVVEAKRDKFVLTDESTNGTFVVNQDNEVAFLRRDAMTLQGQGLILFGGEPGSTGTAHVAYRCLLV